MTLTIDLTSEQQAALQAEATARGLELSEFARLRLLETLPGARTGTDQTPAEVLAGWKAEGLLGLFANRPEDGAEIARQLRESAWKRAC